MVGEPSTIISKDFRSIEAASPGLTIFTSAGANAVAMASATFSVFPCTES